MQKRFKYSLGMLLFLSLFPTATICMCTATYYLCLPMYFSFLLHKLHRGITMLGSRLCCVVWVSLCLCDRLNSSSTASQENKSVCDWQRHLTEAGIDVLFIRILLNPVQTKYSVCVLSHKQVVSGCRIWSK